MPTFRLVVIALAVMAATSDPAEACSCAAFPTLEQQAESAAVVVAGQVAAVGPGRAGSLDATDPMWVDLDVTQVAKGEPLSGRIRVWHDMAGTSCGGAFAKLKVGTRLVAVASEQAWRRWTQRTLRP